MLRNVLLQLGLLGLHGLVLESFLDHLSDGDVLLFHELLFVLFQVLNELLFFFSELLGDLHLGFDLHVVVDNLLVVVLEFLGQFHRVVEFFVHAVQVFLEPGLLFLVRVDFNVNLDHKLRSFADLSIHVLADSLDLVLLRIVFGYTSI